MEDLGDCFPAAARALDEDDSRTLVHGLVRGFPGSLVDGVRFWHAWTEHTERLELANGFVHDVVWVVDRSNGGDLVLPADAYYNIGNVTVTHRYTVADVRRLTVETGHWGPWHHLLRIQG